MTRAQWIGSETEQCDIKAVYWLITVLTVLHCKKINTHLRKHLTSQTYIQQIWFFQIQHNSNTLPAHDFIVLWCEQNMSLAHNCSMKKKHHLHTTAVWTKHVICTQLQCEQSMSFAHNCSVNKASHLHTTTVWTKHVICTQLQCEQSMLFAHNCTVTVVCVLLGTVNKTHHLHTTAL